jgi:hypothetical protein
MTAISWGHGIEAAAERLMEESTKARENGERYAQMTAENAAAARRERSRAGTKKLHVAVGREQSATRMSTAEISAMPLSSAPTR